MKREEVDFACVIHPLNLQLLSEAFEDGLKRKRDSIVKRILHWVPPFKCSIITGIYSKDTNKKIKGALISYILLPEQILSSSQAYLVNKLIKTVKFAQEKLKAKIIGLEAYLPQIDKRGMYLRKALNVPITTGRNYSVAIVKKSIIKIAEKIGRDLSSLKIAIVGATGSIGKICSKIFSKRVGYLYLIARNEQRLKNLAQTLKKDLAEIVITTNVSEGIKEADIVITTTNTPYEIVDVSFLKPGAIVFDVSLPRNISQKCAESRKDILVIDAGIVRPPGNPDFHFYFGLPPGLCYACMAETMILALEERYESYSMGANVSEKRVEEIEKLGDKHGFELIEFMSYGRQVEIRK